MSYDENRMRCREDNPERYEPELDYEGENEKEEADHQGEVETEFGNNFTVEGALEQIK